MAPSRWHKRRRYPVSGSALAIVGGRPFPVATGFRARLLGLTLLDRELAGPGLLIPRCRRVHTFGMRFLLDIVFLDAEGEPISVRRDVPASRFLFEPRAAAVLELPAGGGFPHSAA